MVEVDGRTAEAAVAQAFREERALVVATLIRVTGDWDLAEECVQDAFALAVRTWPRDGVPARPGAWLTTTARNRAIDRIRRETVGAGKLREAARLIVPEEPGNTDESGVPDDRLRLIFTCCHPALAVEAQVALALRTLAGLSTAEIARAFLVPEPTMSQRLVRVKRKIRTAGIPYRVPPAHLLPERLAAVLGVLYLLFNEGYTASAGPDLQRPDLAAEAIRLARVLASLMPDETEVAGLFALMLLQHARRDTRVTSDGDLVPLDEQDRTRWDTAAITEGTALLEAALRRGEPGRYQIQAAIAACHTPEGSDWPQIAGLYGELLKHLPTPVVELNRAVAVGMAAGPAAGLALADELTARGDLAGYHLLPATRADFLRRLGRTVEARAAYTEALALAGTGAERAYLTRRISELPGAGVSVPAPAVRRLGEPTPETEGHPVIGKTLRLPGTELHYELDGSGPVLLLVPGGPADATAFTGLRPLLTSRYTVVTFDPRGISRSAVTGEPGPDLVGDHAEDVHRLLAEIGGEPAYVFANSGGAITMLEHLKRHPGQVRTLVAHEPPVSRYLGEMLAEGPDIPAIYREHGTEAAFAAFMAGTGFEVPPPPAAPTPEEIEQGKRMQANLGFFFGHLMAAIGQWEPDLDALRASSARLVIGVGAAAEGTPAHTAGLGLARELGLEPVPFTGDHGGFAGQPGPFAEQLTAVLDQH
ncbi:RNA polymerase sigma factor, sigma-70 family [Amycolatopsis saalfeldensis]|uniref:RNA polymerase sigma factor, sigma-70 family n=1 Tax=Amycolatopsis saalfeldensis TaxID=394193 RepID=A0A1H8SVU1_9PSEU|nr:RNA polymerase sigma factor, sigma-70 family [Amycolatopsis saalfeldensis]